MINEKLVDIPRLTDNNCYFLFPQVYSNSFCLGIIVIRDPLVCENKVLVFFGRHDTKILSPLDLALSKQGF